MSFHSLVWFLSASSRSKSRRRRFRSFFILIVFVNIFSSFVFSCPVCCSVNNLSSSRCLRRLSLSFVQLSRVNETDNWNHVIYFNQGAMKIFGLEFAPIHLPIERRLQTLSVVVWGQLFLWTGLATTLVLAWCFFYSKYLWPLTISYVFWYVYDFNICNQGGHR